MIAVIDYGVGNLFSVEKALVHCTANIPDAKKQEVVVTNNPELIKKADKLVLPGVGAFGDCMENLKATGLIPLLKEKIAEGTPLLGICVGLQILFEGSEESPGAEGLGIIKGYVRKINAPGLKIPHMGWNSIKYDKNCCIYKNLSEQPYVYFVHSFHGVPEDSTVITATAEYGETITASVSMGNVLATQFHPEKSGDVGLHILENFVMS